MRIRALLASLLAIAALLLAPATSAQILYAATGSNGVDGELYRVNPSTAVETLVGPIRVGALPISVTGLAAHPTTRVLYGVTPFLSPNFPLSLVTVNTATGAATVIGGGNTLAQVVNDISFSPGGVLFGYRRNADRIVTIDLTTGVATPALNTTGTGSACGGSIAFAGATLFSTKNRDDGNVETIDTTTGIATVGAALTGAPAGFGCINALASNGAQLLGVDTDQAGVAATTLISINRVTGAITNIGDLPDDTDALAFAAAAPGTGVPHVPTLGEGALILLVLAFAAIGMGAVSRRR